MTEIPNERGLPTGCGPQHPPATLYLRDMSGRAPLAFAARALLDAMNLDMPLTVAAAPDAAACGLSLLGDKRIPLAELEAVFASLSLRREIATGRQDRFARFDEAAIDWDISRPWIDLRARELAQQFGQPERTEEPFRVIISHDVDRTTSWEPTAILRTFLKAMRVVKGHWFPLGVTFSSGALEKSIQRLLDFEAAQGIAAYYFMMSGPYRLGRHSTRTDIGWRSARAIARSIRQAGMTLGLHGSFSARQRDTYREEKDRLQQALGCRITCHRNHYLCFDPRRLWSQLEAAGIDYDFSLGFVSRLGFRTASGRVHRTYDFPASRMSRVRAVPLLYMDTMLMDDPSGDTFRRLTAALEHVKQIRGCVSLLFHPEYFLCSPAAWRQFERIVAVCKELGADLSGRLPATP